MIRHLKTAKSAEARADDDARVRATVEAILSDIERRGDAAVRALVADLWAAAVTIDAGDTLDEEKALQAARDALAEALRSGASEEQAARRTREWRQAMEGWPRAMAPAAPRGPGRRFGCVGGGLVRRAREAGGRGEQQCRREDDGASGNGHGGPPEPGEGTGAVLACRGWRA